MTTPVGSDLTLDSGTETALNAGWITREDFALKVKLRGIRVSVLTEKREHDHDGGMDEDHDDGPVETLQSKTRSVPVYFRLPENELVRRNYPYIVIDFLAPVRLSEEEHRGYATFGTTENAYTPPGMPTAGGRTEMPIPFMLQYQITTYARFQQHDRAIMTELLTNRLDPRFGFLEMTPHNDAPDDLSLRRLDLLSGPTNGDTRDEHQKRLFRKMYTVGVSSWLFPSEFERLTASGRLVLDVVPLE